MLFPFSLIFIWESKQSGITQRWKPQPVFSHIYWVLLWGKPIPLWIFSPEAVIRTAYSAILCRYAFFLCNFLSHCTSKHNILSVKIRKSAARANLKDKLFSFFCTWKFCCLYHSSRLFLKPNNKSRTMQLFSDQNYISK
jgi:hypothetical protein